MTRKKEKLRVSMIVICKFSIPPFELGRRFWSYLALDARLVHNLVNVVGSNARLGSSGSEIEDLTRELADLAHGFYALGVENVKLVAVGQRAAVLGVAIFGPHGVRDRLGNGSVLGQRVDRSEGSREWEARERIVVTGCWIW